MNFTYLIIWIVEHINKIRIEFTDEFQIFNVI